MLSYNHNTMKQNLAFNFTDEPPQQAPDSDFKKQRAAYLAERNARKRQAQIILKRQRGHSTSSDDAPPSPKKQANFLGFREKTDERYGDCSSKKEEKREHPSQFQEFAEESDSFKRERAKYKAERTAHRQEVARMKQGQFGCSSSDEDSLPVEKTPSIQELQPNLKEKSLSNHSGSEYDSQLFNSVDMGRSPREKGGLNHSVRLRMEGGERRRGQERFQIEVPSKKGINIWLEKSLQFRAQTVQIGERSIPLYDLNKVKLFFVRTPNGNCKMKVCCRDEDIFFAVDHKKLHELCLDHYYYLFAKIITLKLQLMGKISQDKEGKQKGQVYQLSQNQLKGAQLTGKVRKSSFFGGWEPTVGVINQSGLCIYKEGKEKPTLVVSYNTVREIWTRFDFDNDNLILKFIHNSSKVELSIPLENYLSRDNWLYHLYNLASK